MNCYECMVAGKTVTAVAICQHCGVGLCLEHLRKAQAYHAGGTLYGCPHQPAGTGRPQRGVMTGAAAPDKDARAPASSAR